jgi:hypothetical protein
MDSDKYQLAWQAHFSHTRVTIDPDLLLKVVQRNQRDFRATILRRDVIEVGVGLLLLPYWFYAGITQSLPWTWWLSVPAIVFVVGFFLVDRMRHPETSSDPGEPLLSCVKNSLTQVEHQIWLLCNVFWWYLLPPTISILAFFAHVTWLRSEDWLHVLGHAGVFVFLFAICSYIYYVNQYAVRKQLEPRRQELLTLLTSLGDETTSGEYVVMKSADGVKTSGILRHPISVLVLLVTLAVLGSAVAVLVCPATQDSKRAPYTGVRWEGDTPVVKIGEEWFKLVSLDGRPLSDIVAFSRRTYGNKWRKRFAEDLVEVLIGMGHVPKDTVRLVVMPLGSQETRTLEDVPITRANRQAIWDAAREPSK